MEFHLSDVVYLVAVSNIHDRHRSDGCSDFPPEDPEFTEGFAQLNRAAVQRSAATSCCRNVRWESNKKRVVCQPFVLVFMRIDQLLFVPVQASLLRVL